MPSDPSDPTSPPAAPDAQSEAVPQFVRLGERMAGHEAMEPLVGEWDVTLFIYVAGGTPENPIVKQLRGLREWNGGERFVREVLEGDDFWRHGMLGYSTMDERYEFVTQDGMNANMMVYLAAAKSGPGLPIDMVGTFTDQGVISDATVGEPIGQRTVITLQDRDNHRVELFFTPPGEAERLADRKDFVRRH